MKKNLKHSRFYTEKYYYLFLTTLLMVLGLFLFKLIPIIIFGSDILFDASAHITIACFFLYVIYLGIEKNTSWRIPYFIFAFAVIVIVSVQRIIINAHNDIGLLIGFIISIISIMLPRWKKIKNKFSFN
jgi:heme/copper-type cytochrome/quinol oxidase subunit 4